MFLEFIQRTDTYLSINKFAKGVACHNLMIFCVLSYLPNENRYDLSLNFRVVLENVNRIHKHIAKLVWISLSQQEFDALTLSQVFIDSKSLDFFLWLCGRNREWAYETMHHGYQLLTICGKWNSSFSEMSSLRLARIFAADVEWTTLVVDFFSTIKLTECQIN